MYVLGDDKSIGFGSLMQTKHICVLIRIRIKGRRKTCLSPSVIFSDHFKVVLLLRILFVIDVSRLSFL